MDRDEALELLRGGNDGVSEWNRRRRKGEEIPILSSADLSGAMLSHADFTDADLSRADLRSADLCKANLSKATLTDTNLFSANLNDANLSGAELFGADLRNADLRNANMRSACLFWTNLSGAKMEGSSVEGAQCSRTVWGETDLSLVSGLGEIKHEGPSVLDVVTLQKTEGGIPQAFLEGCGVPDNWITYLPSLIGKAIDLYSCFISYSHEDEEFCKRLHSRMRDDKLRVWYAPEDMKSGQKIHEQIDTAIRLHDKLLVVLSEYSMKSEWVTTEVRKARKREVKEGKRILFPIRMVPFDVIRDWEAFDADTGKDMAVEIREYFIPDFSNWKDHDSFEAAYQRLMKDLKPSPKDGAD